MLLPCWLRVDLDMDMELTRYLRDYDTVSPLPSSSIRRAVGGTPRTSQCGLVDS